MSEFVKVLKTSSSRICSGPIGNSKTDKASFLISASLSFHELLFRSLATGECIENQKASDLLMFRESHVLTAMQLANLGIGNSLKTIRARAESVINSIDGGIDDRFRPLIDSVLSRDRDFLRLTFGRDLADSEIYLDGVPLSEYIFSKEGRYLFDESLLSNYLTNIIDASKAPYLRRSLFRYSVGGAMILAKFGQFSEFKDSNGDRNYSVYLDSTAIADAICDGASIRPKRFVALVGEMPSGTLDHQRSEGTVREHSLDNGRKVVEFDIDDENSPECSKVIRKLFPDAAVILGKDIRSDLFEGLDFIRADSNLDLDKVFEYGPAYTRVMRIRELMELRKACGFDELDRLVIPRIRSRLGMGDERWTARRPESPYKG